MLHYNWVVNFLNHSVSRVIENVEERECLSDLRYLFGRERMLIRLKVLVWKGKNAYQT